MHARALVVLLLIALVAAPFASAGPIDDVARYLNGQDCSDAVVGPCVEYCPTGQTCSYGYSVWCAMWVVNRCAYRP